MFSIRPSWYLLTISIKSDYTVTMPIMDVRTAGFLFDVGLVILLHY